MAINGASDGNKYPQQYLNEINDVLTNRMDGNGDKKDGKVTVSEAYNDLNIGSLLSGLKEGSNEYNMLKALTDKIPETLKKYAGSDGIFQAEEWADFLNGNEWGAVIDQYHSSSNFSKIEMGWIDNTKGMIPDGSVTKGEVKVGLLNKVIAINPNFDTTRIENLVDKYAGEDGTFTVEEYTAMKNDPEYKAFLNQFRVVPFGISNQEANTSDSQFAKSLPTNPDAEMSTLQVGHGAKKIKGFFAKNPETGEMVYADENGRRFTEQAFRNWEQFAKDGTFVY